jgi:hypothetical protein
LSHSTTGKAERRSRGYRALGLFAAVWLNLALAPCAMATAAEGDHDCPHCPPAEMQGHHDMHAGMDAEMPCADGLSDCELDGDFSHDTRSSQSKSKDVQGELPVAISVNDLAIQIRGPVRDRSPPNFSTVHAGAPPPLHILYCVFLD